MNLPFSFGSQYDLVGGFGQLEGGTAVYLARELATDELVALRVQGEDESRSAEDVEVIRTLNASVPAPPRRCHICATQLTDWRRFCDRCGTDLAIGGHARPDGDALAEILAASERPLELLGEMPRAEGGASVLFARDRSTGEVVAVTLKPALGGINDEQTVVLDFTALFEASKRSKAGVVRTPEPPSARQSSVASSAAEGTDATGKICPTCSTSYGAGVRFCPLDGAVLQRAGGGNDLIGQVVAERYHILRRIGSGGMGEVYLAEHVRMGGRRGS